MIFTTSKNYSECRIWFLSKYLFKIVLNYNLKSILKLFKYIFDSVILVLQWHVCLKKNYGCTQQSQILEKGVHQTFYDYQFFGSKFDLFG